MLILDKVTPTHVSEAFNLLNKSIIRVEQPDVNLDDDEDNDLNRIPDSDGKLDIVYSFHLFCRY